MSKYDFLNVLGVKIGDDLDSAIKRLSSSGIVLKEVSNANKRIRQLYIGDRQSSFNGVMYDSIQLDFMDNLLFGVVLSEMTELEKGKLKYIAENKKMSSVFGHHKLEKETEVLREYFYTDTFVSCIARYSKIIALDKTTKGYINIRYFDNISELSQDRTLSNPSIVSIIKENLSTYKNIYPFEKNTSTNTKQKLVNTFLVLRVLVGMLLGILLVLFGLNGRYERLQNGVIFDKWKKEVITMGTDELPIKQNGETIKQK